jgi:hypothetical protein
VIEEICEKRGVVASNSLFVGFDEIAFASGGIRKESSCPGEVPGSLVIHAKLMAEHPQGEVAEGELRIDGYGLEERFMRI